jgi:hypothetical protein
MLRRYLSAQYYVLERSALHALFASLYYLDLGHGIMSSPKPYTIAVPDAQIQRLRQRIELTTFPDELEDAGSDYGAPLEEVKRIASYWKDQYDWRQVEAELNRLPHYTVTIDVEGFAPIDVHFIHQKSRKEGAIPLLFVHGCKLAMLKVT